MALVWMPIQDSGLQFGVDSHGRFASINVGSELSYNDSAGDLGFPHWEIKGPPEAAPVMLRFTPLTYSEGATAGVGRFTWVDSSGMTQGLQLNTSGSPNSWAPDPLEVEVHSHYESPWWAVGFSYDEDRDGANYHTFLVEALVDDGTGGGGEEPGGGGSAACFWMDLLGATEDCVAAEEPEPPPPAPVGIPISLGGQKVAEPTGEPTVYVLTVEEDTVMEFRILSFEGELYEMVVTETTGSGWTTTVDTETGFVERTITAGEIYTFEVPSPVYSDDLYVRVYEVLY